MSSQIRRRTSTAPPRASAIKIFERNKEAPVAPKRTTKEAIILFSLCLIAILGMLQLLSVNFCFIRKFTEWIILIRILGTIAVMSTIGLSSDKGLQKQRRSAVLPRSRQGRSYEYLARDACSEWGALPQFDEGHNKWWYVKSSYCLAVCLCNKNVSRMTCSLTIIRFNLFYCSQSNCMSGYCPSDICQCTVPIVKPASTWVPYSIGMFMFWAIEFSQVHNAEATCTYSHLPLSSKPLEEALAWFLLDPFRLDSIWNTCQLYWIGDFCDFRKLHNLRLKSFFQVIEKCVCKKLAHMLHLIQIRKETLYLIFADKDKTKIS